MSRNLNQAAQRHRFRFSIGSMLTFVTVIGGLFGYIQLKLRLIESDTMMDPIRDLVERSSISQEYLFLITQLVSLVVVLVILYRQREPVILWFYFLGHSVWFATGAGSAAGMGRLFPWLGDASWFGDAVLIALFFEPSFAFVISLVVCVLAIANRKSRPIIAALVLLAVSMLAELSATIAFDTFRRALAALMGMPR